ncbi:MAG: hypothetical protein JWP33_2785 [Blastococcus sp.]|nr:hypothetical protein [Blastococcus sp.]
MRALPPRPVSGWARPAPALAEAAIAAVVMPTTTTALRRPYSARAAAGSSTVTSAMPPVSSAMPTASRPCRRRRRGAPRYGQRAPGRTGRPARSRRGARRSRPPAPRSTATARPRGRRGPARPPRRARAGTARPGRARRRGGRRSSGRGAGWSSRGRERAEIAGDLRGGVEQGWHEVVLQSAQGRVAAAPRRVHRPSVRAPEAPGTYQLRRRPWLGPVGGGTRGDLRELGAPQAGHDCRTRPPGGCWQKAALAGLTGASPIAESGPRRRSSHS